MNCRTQRELIYSQPRLATSLLLQNKINEDPHSLLIKWWMLRDSNPRPLPCKGSTLPTELSIHHEHCLAMLFKYNTFIYTSQLFLLKFFYFFSYFLICFSFHSYNTLHLADRKDLLPINLR